ncbi:hypothetical protein DPMN_011105 [Dreissena polymorpha]|uniref:Uncharacterized protein n=1 Tax=Dreissena polymorpha TaxID=45954 RepID=A0A9D4N137_DREPO|nr:hypothetical protein DPMN_011105 [Dreissena polymorpha]
MYRSSNLILVMVSDMNQSTNLALRMVSDMNRSSNLTLRIVSRHAQIIKPHPVNGV